MGSAKFFSGLTAMLTIFVVTMFTETRAAAQQVTVLYNFGGYLTDAYFSNTGLILDAAGNLYGTTGGGGVYCSPHYDCGAVFELSPQPGGGWTEKIIHSFDNNGTDGYVPFSSLVLDSLGNLYGTTFLGGAHGVGTIFQLTPAAGGNWTEKVLYSFSCKGHGGCNPRAGLILDAAGNLYGTASRGGNGANCRRLGCGTVFELTPTAGGTWEQKVLHVFGSTIFDGTEPFSSLVFDTSGNLYGTTYQGGTYSYYGTVFELRPNATGSWSETILHNFNWIDTDGAYPVAGVIVGPDGSLYGTTTYAGRGSEGTAFKLAPTHGANWTLKILHSFGVNGTDGNEPYGGVVADAAGNLYGTTYSGGTGCCGTVFELLPAADGSWTEMTLYNLDPSNGVDGAYPYSGLVLDLAGNLYGTTSRDGAYAGGNVFEVTP